MIAVQILLLLALPLMLWRPVRPGHSRQTPPLDIGAFFAAIVVVYGTLPLIGLALAYAGVGSVQDARLGDGLPDPAAVNEVGWVFVLFLAGFVFAYRWSRRGHSSAAAPLSRRPQTRDVWRALALFATVQVGIASIRFAYDIGPGSDYLDSYAVVRDQPLFVQQVMGLLVAADFAAAVLLIVTIIAWRPRWHWAVALGIAFLLLQTLVLGGSRAYAFRCGLAYVVARSICGPRLKPATLLTIGVLGVVAFLAVGAVRQTMLDGEPASPLALVQGGEFMAFFGNGLDLTEKAPEIQSPTLNTALYLVDVLRLVPRQIIGDLKVDPATFYASTFYPEFYESGGAYAFGAIAESALGFGAPEALVRGALLGLAYGMVRRLISGNRASLWGVVTYTWFVVVAYEGLRDTTLSAFPRFVLQALPLLMVAWALGILKTPSSNKHPGTTARPPGIKYS